MTEIPTLQAIDQASERLKSVVTPIPLQRSQRLSEQYNAEIYLKREDLQTVRSYKIRGAFNLLATLENHERGVVCASAGNHAQGVALSCHLLGIKGHIFMPQNAPRQKVNRVRALGREAIDLVLVGDTFDAANEVAKAFATEHAMAFVHPFDDARVIAGQGTVAKEIFAELQPEMIVLPVGGGGLAAGVCLYASAQQSATQVIGVEPEGAASMQMALHSGNPVTLAHIDTFVDGAAVRRVGDLPFRICRDLLFDVITVPKGKICVEMLALYQNDGIIAEPAGALSIAALDSLDVQGKTVVCVISGGNNDITRYADIQEQSLIYQGLKHYFIINFPQRPGALRQFLDDALGAGDDITLFEYMKKGNREFGPALVGIELGAKEGLSGLLERMEAIGLGFETIEAGSEIYRFLL